MFLSKYIKLLTCDQFQGVRARGVHWELMRHSFQIWQSVERRATNEMCHNCNRGEKTLTLPLTRLIKSAIFRSLMSHSFPLVLFLNISRSGSPWAMWINMQATSNWINTSGPYLCGPGISQHPLFVAKSTQKGEKITFFFFFFLK